MGGGGGGSLFETSISAVNARVCRTTYLGSIEKMPRFEDCLI